MGSPREPRPCKYFVALLSRDAELLTRVEVDLVSLLGVIDGRSNALPWTLSHFYEQEMGGGLLRRFVSFAPLRSPADLSEIKLRTQAIEQRYRRPPPNSSGRAVNLDPGYIESGKVVLASTKNASHRIYLSRGIYAEATLQYYDGGFNGCPYTYPDYLWPETLEFLRTMRLVYLEQLRRSAG
jgi:hypothetical protein